MRLRRTTTGGSSSSRVLAAGLLAVAVSLTATTAAGRAAIPGASTGGGPTVLQALPPGNSGFFPLTGQAEGTVTGRPGDFGPHVDDQRAMYWGFRYAAGGFERPTGTPATPRPGVRVYRDALGVPLVFGADAYDTWYGVGYASAQDRLFEMDAIRRLAEGRLAALVGPSAVPGDVQARVLGYTAAQYAQQFAALPRSSQTAIVGYVAGVNAWISRVRRDPRELPAEYAVLSALPTAWTVQDTLAAGVLITRSVASEGGDEFANVAALRALVDTYGVAGGQARFNDLYWLSDPKAMTTVPAVDGSFPNDPTPPSQREAVFAHLARYALSLPPGLAAGPGTGAYPVPGTTRGAPALPAVVRHGLARAVASVEAWGAQLHGGSYEYVVAPWRTAAHRALLESAPQLGWSYPSELWEVQVEGGGYQARGITVPGLPVVGIGFNRRVAWALTTGNSKTIDTFIETTRPNPNGSPVAQYLHNGRWLTESCRQETVHYRAQADGVPVGPAVESVTVPVCRTLHGPIVATAGNLASSVDYAMWGREVETINGILTWDRARDFAQFARGVAEVTWNENVMYAGADGHIAYWHPGLYPLRSPLADQRLPVPGTGAYDWRGLLPFRDMPHVVDPAQGYLANWNTTPARGWTNEVSGGAIDHVGEVTRQLGGAHRLTLADLVGIDRNIGNSDAQALVYLPLLRQLAADHRLPLTALAHRYLDLLAGWNGEAANPTAGVNAGNTDPPAATLFAAWVAALRQDLFGPLMVQLSVLHRDVSLHVYNLTPADDLALRVLDPASSGLVAGVDYLHGRTPAQVELAALGQAATTMVNQFHTLDVTRWRRAHPRSGVCSLTGGAVGPCLTMPYEDRGSYIQLVQVP